ncbi:MAG: hypothetical protein D3910_03130 [Candidatus Electrothrix sp. ATG2]|nr:hypothetical protein [Candidatus Electrothrix sp. ATG2]
MNIVKTQILAVLCLCILMVPIYALADKCDDVVEQASEIFDNAAAASEQGDYQEAATLYEKAATYYKKASRMKKCRCPKIAKSSRNNKQYGQGKYTYPDGSVYDGDWQDDKRHGYGRLADPDGDTYIGGWENDKKNGKGILTFANGSVKKGRWINDKFSNEKKSKDKETRDKDFMDMFGSDLADAADQVE